MASDASAAAADFNARWDRYACTRTAKSTGRRCGQHRESWPAGLALQDPRSCRFHMTDEERATREAYLVERAAESFAEFGGFFDRLDPGERRVPAPGRFRTGDPACWSWPTPATFSFSDEDGAEEFLWWWNHDCAICGSADNLVTDHDHKTGLVRGRLCIYCNAKEGHADDKGIFGKYRQRNPASILGVKIRYWSPWTGYAEPEPVLTPEEEVPAERRMRDAVDRMFR